MQITFRKAIQAAGLSLTIGILTACSDANAVNDGTDAVMVGATLSQIQSDNKAKENYLVIDVRGADEYSAGHLKHAINFPLEDMQNSLYLLDKYKNKNIVLYCNTGKRSAKAADLLKQNGFTKVQNADGVKDYSYELYSYANLTAEEFLNISNTDDYLVIDVRAPKDYEAGHIKGAINIPDGEPVQNYTEILEANKDKNIVTYCYTGNRSAKLAKTLSDNGYKVYNLLDGTKEYSYNLVNE
ncbi:MAG: rhodanese-like domain-containing protein [Campylobacter sp.]|nr:rhodanese-like domain-containing protein [Campylobacter sp.]